MKKKIYANYGVLGAEKTTLFSVYHHKPIYDELFVELPDEILAGENGAGELILNLEGEKCLFHQVLSNDKNGNPCIILPSPTVQKRSINLKVLK